MHDDASRPQWRFSLRDLLIAVGCIAVFLAILLPLIQRTRDVTRQFQCELNLKQQLLAVHNFHDNFNGLPPLGIGDRRASMFVILEPYYASTPLFHGGNRAQDTDLYSPMDGPSGVWSRLTPAEQDQVASRTVLRCPSRGRPRSALVLPCDAAYFGPVSDYAVVFFHGRDRYGQHEDVPKEFRALQNWEEHYDACSLFQVTKQQAALRLAWVDCTGLIPNYAGWKPRDTFARILSGTSNTLFLGEKYVRPGELGRYANDPEQQDGTYLFESDRRRSATVVRNLWFPLAHGVHDTRFRPGAGKSPQRDFGFGGPHAAGVLFAKGDGSVLALSPQTNRAVLARYAHCQEGFWEETGEAPPPEDFSRDDSSEPPLRYGD